MKKIMMSLIAMFIMVVSANAQYGLRVGAKHYENGVTTVEMLDAYGNVRAYARYEGDMTGLAYGKPLRVAESELQYRKARERAMQDAQSGYGYGYYGGGYYGGGYYGGYYGGYDDGYYPRTTTRNNNVSTSRENIRPRTRSNGTVTTVKSDSERFRSLNDLF